MPEPMISTDEALSYLQIAEPTASDLQLIDLLVSSVAAAIITYCRQDPRNAIDPELSPDEQEEQAETIAATLQFVASRMLMLYHSQITNQTIGIDAQSFGDVSIKHLPEQPLDPFSKQLLDRHRKITIV